MRIFIVGYEGSGKSTAAQYLADALDCHYAETGDVVIKELARLYVAGSAQPETVLPWFRMIRMCKRDYRGELEALGTLITRVSPTALIDECCKGARIVVGVRRLCEMIGYQKQGERGGWRSVWIDIARPEVAISPGYQMHQSVCEYEVFNDGSLKDLKRQMEAIADQIKKGTA